MALMINKHYCPEKHVGGHAKWSLLAILCSLKRRLKRGDGWHGPLWTKDDSTDGQCTASLQASTNSVWIEKNRRTPKTWATCKQPPQMKCVDSAHESFFFFFSKVTPEWYIQVFSLRKWSCAPAVFIIVMKHINCEPHCLQMRLNLSSHLNSSWKISRSPWCWSLLHGWCSEDVSLSARLWSQPMRGDLNESNRDHWSEAVEWSRSVGVFKQAQRLSGSSLWYPQRDTFPSSLFEC